MQLIEQLIIGLAPLKEFSLATPNMSATDILVWANEAAVKIHTYTYLTYRRDLQQIQNYFWPNAWDVYQRALKTQHYKKSLITQQMAVSAVAADVPLLLKQGVNNGRYTWKVEVPLLLHFQGGRHSLNQKISLTLVIQRTPPYLGKRGVGIVRIEEKKNYA